MRNEYTPYPEEPMPATTEAPQTVTHEIRNRWTGAMIFAAAVDASLTIGRRIGLTVRLAIETDAVLTGAVLTGADLTGAVLRRADLTDAALTGADLTDAVLTGAALRRADLTGADLTGADLTGAVLTGADLTGAALRGAKIIKVIARAVRSDGYEAIAFATDKGVVIRMGCRTWFGTDAGRAHVATYAERSDRTEEIAAETLAILDFIDASAKQVGA